SYRTFRTPAELARLVRDDLAVLLSEQFAAARSPAAERPRAGARGPRPLPADMTSLVGREQDIGEVASLLGPPGARLVTLTGAGAATPGGRGPLGSGSVTGRRGAPRWCRWRGSPIGGGSCPALAGRWGATWRGRKHSSSSSSFSATIRGCSSSTPWSRWSRPA